MVLAVCCVEKFIQALFLHYQVLSLLANWEKLNTCDQLWFINNIDCCLFKVSIHLLCKSLMLSWGNFCKVFSSHSGVYTLIGVNQFVCCSQVPKESVWKLSLCSKVFYREINFTKVCFQQFFISFTSF